MAETIQKILPLSCKSLQIENRIKFWRKMMEDFIQKILDEENKYKKKMIEKV